MTNVVAFVLGFVLGRIVARLSRPFGRRDRAPIRPLARTGDIPPVLPTIVPEQCELCDQPAAARLHSDQHDRCGALLCELHLVEAMEFHVIDRRHRAGGTLD